MGVWDVSTPNQTSRGSPHASTDVDLRLFHILRFIERCGLKLWSSWLPAPFPNTWGESTSVNTVLRPKKISQVLKTLVASLCLPGLCTEIDPLYLKGFLYCAYPSPSIQPCLPWAPPKQCSSAPHWPDSNVLLGDEKYISSLQALQASIKFQLLLWALKTPDTQPAVFSLWASNQLATDFTIKYFPKMPNLFSSNQPLATHYKCA